jgi:hypothetical protein
MPLTPSEIDAFEDDYHAGMLTPGDVDRLIATIRDLQRQVSESAKVLQDAREEIATARHAVQAARKENQIAVSLRRTIAEQAKVIEAARKALRKDNWYATIAFEIENALHAYDESRSGE